MANKEFSYSAHKRKPTMEVTFGGKRTRTRPPKALPGKADLQYLTHPFMQVPYADLHSANWKSADKGGRIVGGLPGLLRNHATFKFAALGCVGEIDGDHDPARSHFSRGAIAASFIISSFEIGTSIPTWRMRRS
jgi:hypothetical protein